MTQSGRPQMFRRKSGKRVFKLYHSLFIGVVPWILQRREFTWGGSKNFSKGDRARGTGDEAKTKCEISVHF